MSQHRARVVPVAVACLLAACAAWAHPGMDQQIHDLTERIKAEPKNAELYMRRGELHRLHRDWPAALADYARARELDPELTVVELCEGTLRLDAGQHKQAKKIMDRFLAVETDRADAYAVRARALVALGKHLEAAEDFGRALALSGRDRHGPDYYLERARALDAAGEKHVPRAIASLDEGIEALGQPITLELLAIDLELKLERYDAALARLDRIAARSARKETWLLRKGEILEMAERPERALEAYTQVLSAIENLPVHRRRNRAVTRLLDQARAAVERLQPGVKS